MKQTNTKQKKIQKLVQGELISLTVGKDTAKVEVERKLKHPVYEKLIKKHTKYVVHIAEVKKADLKVGQQVSITPCAPMSAKKRWKIVL